MTRTLPFIALLILSACDRQEAAPPAPTAADTPAATPVAKAAVPSLDGQWRVTAPAALDLTIGNGQATLSSGCVRRGFTIKQDRNKVSVKSSPAGSANCGTAPSAGTENAAAALAEANLAIFGSDGRTVTLSGTGGILSLERR